jgi:hypothetical protein
MMSALLLLSMLLSPEAPTAAGETAARPGATARPDAPVTPSRKNPFRRGKRRGTPIENDENESRHPVKGCTGWISLPEQPPWPSGCAGDGPRLAHATPAELYLVLRVLLI